MSFDAEHCMQQIVQKDQRLICGFSFEGCPQLHRNVKYQFPKKRVATNFSKKGITLTQELKYQGKVVGCSPSNNNYSPRLRMSKIKEEVRAVHAQQKKSQNIESLNKERTCTQRCATQQQQCNFSEKFYWKSIPTELKVTSKHVRNQPVKASQTLTYLRPPQKSHVLESTNFYHSIQASNQMTCPLKQSLKDFTTHQHLQTNSARQPKSRLGAEQQIQSKSISIAFSQASWKTYKKFANDIQQVESLSRSRLSNFTSHKEDTVFVLDQSMIDWTYETGFKTPINRAQQTIL